MGQIGKLVSVKVIGEQVVFLEEVILLRMSDGDFVIEHLNGFNSIISQLFS